MSKDIRKHSKYRIFLRIHEKDLTDALLILRSYSCTNYTVTAGRSFCEELTLEIENVQEHNRASADVSAMCAEEFIPSLVDELNCAFGKTILVRVETSST